MAHAAIAERALIRPQYHFRSVGNDVLIWNVARLVDLAAQTPVQDWPLDQISEIDEPYWYDATHGNPTCRSVMDHAAQVAATDLSYPILLCPDGRIMDGMHRIMKAVGEGRNTIRARQLSKLPTPDYRNKHPDDLPY